MKIEMKHLNEALQILVNNNIGVLLVLNEHGKISGILSERDILRECLKRPDTFLNSYVKDSMTHNIIYGEYEDDLTYVEAIMTNNKIRHLPVMNNKVLVGLISIGDLVKAVIRDVKVENKYLVDYIQGNTIK